MEIKKNVRYIYFLLLFLIPSLLYAQRDDVIIFDSTLKLTLSEIFKKISDRAQLHFSYNPSELPLEREIKIKSGSSLTEVMRQLEKDLALVFIRTDNVVIVKNEKRKEKEKHVINGTIRDGASGELLPGASIIIKGTTLGTTSNHYGFFSLSLESLEKYTLQISFIGYQNKIQEIFLERDTTVLFNLEEEKTALMEIEITAKKKEENDLSLTGQHLVTATQIKNIPSLGGEPDALKALQFLPGVQTSNEGTTNLSVRGGSFDQNLYLLDDAPVYNPSHALSFFSVFNPDALQQINFYKGPVPVRYGGRLSSVIDVRMKEGNKNRQVVSGAIGSISSRLTAEGPLTKNDNRLSYIASGRYSYAGLILNGMRYLGEIFNDRSVQNNIAKIHFYDFNLKLNYRKNDKNHFYISAYSGKDNFFLAAITNGYQLAWGNLTSTFRWNHVHNVKLFSNTTAVFSKYEYAYDILDDTRYFRWRAKMQEFIVKQDYDFYPTPAHHLTFGFSTNTHLIQPGSIVPRNESSVIVPYTLDKQQALENSVYAGNEQQLSRSWKAGYGLRYSNISIIGPGTVYQFENGANRPNDSSVYKSGSIIKSYHRLEPRAWFQWQVLGNSHFTFSYDRTNQFLHLLTNSSLGLPTDIWMPSSAQIKPQSADIFTSGFQTSLGKTGIQFQVGTFYKKMSNVIDFKDNADLFVNRYVTSQVLQGKGKSHGYEFQLTKKTTNWEGMLSYTWSKTLLTIPGINRDESYPTRYDKRHNLYFTNTLKLGTRWEISSNFVLATGGAMTIPKGSFYYQGASFVYYSSRNGFRLPTYHRLDLSVRYHSRKNDNRKWKGNWSFDIYNVYGKKNIFTLLAKPTDYDFFTTQVSAIYLFRTVPTITYSFTF